MFKLMTKNADIIGSCNNISWSSDKDTLGTQLTFDSIKDLFEGQMVSLYESDNELIRGIVINKTDNRNTFNYTVQDYGFYLKNKVPIIQFANETASECIRNLISDAYLAGDICDIPTIVNYTYREKSISDIIDDILENAEADQGVKYVREIVGNKLNIFMLEDLKIVPNVIVGDFSVKSSIENMKNEINVISNEEKYNSIVAKACDESLYYWYGKLSETISVDAGDVSKAKNIALNKLKELNKIERSTSLNLVVLDEKAEIKANRLIYLKAGPFLGYYEIKSARHTLADGMHKCDVDIIFDYPHTNVTSEYEDTDLINKIIEDSKNNSINSDGGYSAGGDEGGSTLGSQIVEYAKQFLGTPYVYGGTTTEGFDCSGFTQYVYKHFGISIPRVSEDQINYGTQTSDPVPGDLFFPHTGHVGIYIGNGKVIHSPQTGEVIKISDVWSKHEGFPKYVHVEGV